MRILVIEDEDRMRELLRDGLREHGHTVVAAADAPEGLSLARECSFDVILLDVMLPGMDGWQAMSRLSESNCSASVVMLTACDAELDVIRGLDIGTDDYLTKPFSFPELLVRIGNLQRARLTPRTEMLTLDTLVLDSVRRLAHRGGRLLSLTRTELAVLNCLFKSAGQVVSRAELVNVVWGEGHDISRGNLDSFISLLRKKVDVPRRAAARAHRKRNGLYARPPCNFGAARRRAVAMNVGIRLRLTLLYFSFFAIAAALLSLSSWVLLKHSLDALLLHELEERVDDLEQFLSTQTAGVQPRSTA